MYLLNNNKVFRCISIGRDSFYRAWPWPPLTYTFLHRILFCIVTLLEFYERKIIIYLTANLVVS